MLKRRLSHFKKKPATPFLAKFIFAIITLTFVFFILNLNSKIIVKKVIINPDSLSCVSSEEIKKTSQISGQNFFLIQEQSMKKNLKEKFLCLDSIDIQKKFPDKIEINLTERKPVVLINAVKNSGSPLDLKSLEATLSSGAASLSFLQFLPEASESAKFLVDNSGFVFSKAQEENNLQVLNIIGEEIALGKTVPNETIKSSLMILNKLEAFSIKPKKITIYNKQIIIEGEPNLFFSEVSSLDRQLASLQLIVLKAKIESKVISSIDLRFNKPVVVYSK